jgi:hypothetical protein
LPLADDSLADSKLSVEGFGITFCPSPPTPDFILKLVTKKASYDTFDVNWHMTIIFVTIVTDTYHKCDTPDMSHTVTQCDTQRQKTKMSQKCKKYAVGKLN